MKKVFITVKITVDENTVKDKYPNYNANWDTIDEFIEHLIDNMNAPEDELINYGFDVRVITRDEAKVEEAEFDLQQENIKL